jgi:hypothetical protein
MKNNHYFRPITKLNSSQDKIYYPKIDGQTVNNDFMLNIVDKNHCEKQSHD